VGDRERVQVYQAVHGRDNLEGFRIAILLLRFACLLYSIWRAVDLLVQVELIGEYEHSPIVTADNTLTLLKKETGIV
jgi:IS4 transposase